MKKIVTLTGHKDCGKVKIAEELSKNSDVYYLKPYTDRPVPNGVYEEMIGDYHFIDKEELDQMIKDDKLLSCTTLNGHRYCFFESQLEEGYNIMIVDDYALVDVQNRYNGELYSVKVFSDKQTESDRVGVYVYNHEFDEVFNYDTGDISELEWRIGYDCD